MAENSVAMIARTVANFLGFSNRSFPIDADGLNEMQINEKLLSVIGNIGGDKYILMGCDNASSYAGFVFLATVDCPQGELLYLESGSLGATIFLKPTVVSVTAEGYEYNGAYTKRTLGWGVGTENFTWSEFKKLETNAQLSAKIATLQTTLAGVVPEAVGSMKFWAGTVENKPMNWLECAGQPLSRTDYSELFAIIGTTYGTTDNVSFNLPNTKGRVPVAYNIDDGDFRPIGKTNNYNTKTHTLITAEMPPHTHDLSVYAPQNQTPTFRPAASWQGVAAEGGSTASTGGYLGATSPHNNLQPYMALPFIIKVK